MQMDERSRTLAELERWQPDELLFRDHARVERGALSEAEFFERWRGDPMNLEYALHPERIEANLTEERFIAAGRNVAVVKHPRWFPLFFHAHEFFEINYVLSGSFAQRLDDRRVALEAGELCMLAPGVRHGIETGGDGILLNLLIRSSTFLDVFVRVVGDRPPLSQFFMSNLYGGRKLRYALFRTGDDAVIRDCALDMCAEQAQEDEYSDRILCSQLAILLNQLMRRHAGSVEIPELRRTDARAWELVEYALAHSGEITLEGLAERFHYSRQYCAKLIREAAGCSFTELLTGARMRKAEQLLTDTALGVAEIGERLGYGDPETFIRAFKRNRGLTPAAYRREAQSTAEIAPNSALVL